MTISAWMDQPVSHVEAIYFGIGWMLKVLNNARKYAPDTCKVCDGSRLRHKGPSGVACHVGDYLTRNEIREMNKAQK